MSARNLPVGIVVGSFMFHVIIMGLSMTFGILYSELHTEFDVAQSTAAWLASLFNGLIGLAGVPVGICVSRFGERKVAVTGAVFIFIGMLTSFFVNSFNWFYITYGITGGLGASMGMLPAATSLMKIPVKNRALSIAICSSGAAVGNLALPPVLSHVISEYGWRGTFLILAGLALQCLPAGLLFVTKSEDKIYTVAGEKLVDASDHNLFKTVSKAIIRNHKFMAFGVSAVLYFSILFYPPTFLPDLMKEVTLSSQQIYMVVMAMGAGHLVGRLLPGLLDRGYQLDLLNMYLFVLFGGIVTSGTYVFVSTFAEFLVLSLFTGLLSGAFMSLHVSLVALYLDREHTEIGFGWICTLEGVAILGGIPLAGLIIDMNGTVRAGFVFTGGMALVSMTSAVVAKCIVTFENRRQMTHL